MIDFYEKHKEDLSRIKNFRLIDDEFMSKVFEDKKCAEFLLQTILQKKDLKVISVHVQHDIKNLQGRSVRLDILAIDSNGKVYNVEVQRSDKGADAKRARYNGSLIDANLTESGDDYRKLAESYIIFITENDVLGGNCPIYHIDRTIRELNHASFHDGLHIIYVNYQIKDDTELGKLMHDFSCSNPKDMKSNILANRAKYFKEDTKGVAAMCRSMELMRDESKQEGRIEGRIEATADLAYRFFLNHGCNFNDACDILGLSPDEKESAKKYLIVERPGEAEKFA